MHVDNLGSVNITTDSSANVVQTLDYYPYGQERISGGDNTTKRHYIGEMFDSSTGLNYLNARYLDSKHGRFVSQDRMFIQASYDLSDPQQANSYSYAGNNPINAMDPTGLFSYKSLLPALKSAGKEFISNIKSTASSFIRIFTDPFGTSESIANTGKSAANKIENSLKNPKPAIKSAANSTGNAVNNFRNSSDEEQGEVLGKVGGQILFFAATRKVPEGVFADEALVVRGGNLINQTPGRFNIQPHKVVGTPGFSVQCNGGTCISDLTKVLPNYKVSVTTVGAVRKAGGDVVSTPGTGFHATVTGLSAEEASKLPWTEFINPNAK
jgi:RHS repeat-associated protein